MTANYFIRKGEDGHWQVLKLVSGGHSSYGHAVAAVDIWRGSKRLKLSPIACMTERDALVAKCGELEKRLEGFRHLTASLLAEDVPYHHELASRWLEHEDYWRIVKELEDA